MSNLVVDKPVLQDGLEMQKSHVESLGTVSNETPKIVSAALTIQSYCLRVLMQPRIDLGGVEKLQEIETAVNDVLEKSKKNAEYYLKKIQPQILRTVNVIQTNCDAILVITGLIQGLSDAKSVTEVLQYPLKLSMECKSQAELVRDELSAFRKKVIEDTQQYQQILERLQSAAEGQSGLLADYDRQITQIEESIARSIGLTLAGVVGIVAGGLMIAVGTCTSIFSGGTSLVIAAAGVAVLGAGITATVAGGIVMANSFQQKEELMRLRAKVSRESQLVREYIGVFKSLHIGAQEATNSTQNMVNAWNFLVLQTDTLIQSVKAGQDNSESIFLAKQLYAPSIKDSVKTILKQIDIIKLQMAGVSVQKVDLEKTVMSEFIRQQLQPTA